MIPSGETESFAVAIVSAVQAIEKKSGCRIALAFKDASRADSSAPGGRAPTARNEQSAAPRDASAGGRATRDLAVEYRGRERFHAASTIKVPVMIEVFRQAEQGRFALTDTLEVNPVFRSMEDGSSFEVHGCDYLSGRIGRRETILKLTEQMIVVSDDLATNLLITFCGAERITRTTQVEIGATQTTVLRCVEDLPAFRAGGMNWVTAHDLVTIFESIETGRAAGAESRAAMRRILLAQELNNMIPARLPKEVRVAHKTGAITGARHDAGIVYAPFGTYFLALLSDGWKDGAVAVETLAELSRVIYDERRRRET